MADDLGSRTRGAALQQALLALDDYLSRVEPGTLLPSERELARRFGVSRTTLRSAITELALRGRLAVRRGTGTVAALGPAPDEPSEPSPTRDAASPRGSAADLAELCELLGARLARMAAQRASTDSGDALASEALSGDRAFLQAVAAASGNGGAKELIAWLHDSIDRAGGNSTPAQVATQERLLVDLGRAVASAIASGDGDAAEGAMTLYLATWRRLSRLA